MVILVSVSVVYFFFRERVIGPPPNSQSGGPEAVLRLASTQIRHGYRPTSAAQLSGSLRHTSSTATARCQPKVKPSLVVSCNLIGPLELRHLYGQLKCMRFVKFTKKTLPFFFFLLVPVYFSRWFSPNHFKRHPSEAKPWRRDL